MDALNGRLYINLCTGIGTRCRYPLNSRLVGNRNALKAVTKIVDWCQPYTAL